MIVPTMSDEPARNNELSRILMLRPRYVPTRRSHNAIHVNIVLLGRYFNGHLPIKSHPAFPTANLAQDPVKIAFAPAQTATVKRKAYPRNQRQVQFL